MRYKIFLVSVLAICLLVGCSRSNDSVTGFVQSNNGELTQNSENEITQDNIVESMENDTQQQSDQISGESINSDILDPTFPEKTETLEHIESESISEGDNDMPNDSTIGPSDLGENSMEVMPQEPEELTENIPTLETENDLHVSIPIPEVEIMPTKTPVPIPILSEAIIPTKLPTSTPTKVPVVPNSAQHQTEVASLSVRGITISLGESKSSVIKKLGSPTRIDETEFTYNFMVYNDNYKKFVMVAIQSDQVVGWYTDATDFSYHGLTGASGVSEINSIYNKKLSIKNSLSVTCNGINHVFFMDMLGDNTIDGILVTSGGTTDGVTSDVLAAWEKEVLDLTNSFRARNGVTSLKWSTEAAKSARLHSQDMADNNYFDHKGFDGSTPFSRMNAQGINFTMAGENIIGGYGNALYSTNGWINSSGHRTNILNSSYNYLGVGYVLGGSYGNYVTQNFFKK